MPFFTGFLLFSVNAIIRSSEDFFSSFFSVVTLYSVRSPRNVSIVSLVIVSSVGSCKNIKFTRESMRYLSSQTKIDLHGWFHMNWNGILAYSLTKSRNSGCKVFLSTLTFLMVKINLVIPIFSST